MTVGEVIQCHHPFYRKVLWNYGKNKNLTLVSHIDNTLPKHDDSMLLFHNACKKCTHVSKITWFHDYSFNNPGEIYQMQARCHHCYDDILLSNYKNKKNQNF